MTFSDLIREAAANAETMPNYIEALENQLRGGVPPIPSAARSSRPDSDPPSPSPDGRSGFNNGGIK